MRKINERTWAEIEAETRNDENGPGREYLPCGAQVGTYWQDENGDQYCACAAGTCQFKLGNQSQLWHVFEGVWA